jgi:hypothetical protein
MSGLSKNQKNAVEMKQGPRSVKLEKPNCRYCGALTRRKFEIGRGKNARVQHGRQRICGNGHPMFVSRGQK